MAAPLQSNILSLSKWISLIYIFSSFSFIYIFNPNLRISGEYSFLLISSDVLKVNAFFRALTPTSVLLAVLILGAILDYFLLNLFNPF